MRTFQNKLIASLCCSALLLASTSQSNAQNGEVGVRFMPTFSSFDMQTSTDGTVTSDVTLGFGGGIFLGFNFTEHVGVQGELIYSSISQESSDVNINRKINLRYVNIPLLLSLNTGKSKVVNLNVVAGPQIGFNVGSSLTQDGTNDANNEQAVLSVKKNDLGFAYGAGIDIGLNTLHTWRLGLGYRGVFGLVDISDKNNNNTEGTYYVLDKAHVRTHAAYIGLSLLF
ncbi:MAG: porin family protein [Flavobacteriales bacterium]|nr:porin family protein [Flavobacteriales bacterium]